MIYVVYALHNKVRNKIYIGYTSNLAMRLERHNGNLPNKKTSFTNKNNGIWRVVYTEEFETRSEAMKREKELKSFREREFIREKIGMPP